MQPSKRPHSFKTIDVYIIINKRTQQSVDKVDYDTRTAAEKAMNEREDRALLTIGRRRKQA